jgi:hypothetical protein
MNLPAYTRTKAEAQKLAADLFPDAKSALASLQAARPDCPHPRYQLTHDTTDMLRAVFYWLHEQKPKIYKRARWHLFYDLARRVVNQMDENGTGKIFDLQAADSAAAYDRKQAAQTMTGDGAGI